MTDWSTDTASAIATHEHDGSWYCTIPDVAHALRDERAIERKRCLTILCTLGDGHPEMARIWRWIESGEAT